MAPHPPLEEVFDVVEDPDHPGEGELILRVQVQPGAGRSAVVGRHGDAVKLKVAAPPEGGRANEAVVALVATTFGVGRDRVQLTAGASSRSKRLRIGPLDLDEARRLLAQAMAGGSGGAARGRRPGR